MKKEPMVKERWSTWGEGKGRDALAQIRIRSGDLPLLHVRGKEGQVDKEAVKLIMRVIQGIGEESDHSQKHKRLK